MRQLIRVQVPAWAPPSPILTTVAGATVVMLSPGRLAQLVRAPRLHRGGHWFEPSTAHHTDLDSAGPSDDPTSVGPAPSGPDLADLASGDRCGLNRSGWTRPSSASKRGSSGPTGPRAHVSAVAVCPRNICQVIGMDPRRSARSSRSMPPRLPRSRSVSLAACPRRPPGQTDESGRSVQ